MNHSTVLVQTDGINILTDPIWSLRCSPLSWLGPRRVRPPGLLLEQLPPIDLVLLSHNHYDHLDLPTLRRLARRDPIHLLAPYGDGLLLRSERLGRVTEMKWWDRLQVSDEIEITYVPARHFSGRGVADRNRSHFGGFVIRSGVGNVYFCGDSGYGSLFRELRQRLEEIRLAFLPIGAYEPRWFMAPVHMNPAEAIRAHLDLGSPRSVGIHFGTFQLTDEGYEQPLVDLETARSTAGVSAEGFVIPEFGGEAWL